MDNITPADAEREAFEKWFCGGDFAGLLEVRADGSYTLVTAHVSWHAWQSRAALAAQEPQVCDSVQVVGESHTEPTLHIYQQPSHHMDAFIFGNREGLEVLKKKIDAVLAGEFDDGEDFGISQNDGECFDLAVRMADDPWIQLLPSAYTDFPDFDDEIGQKAFQAVLSGFASRSPAPEL